ncbi:sugar transferase [bacterium]|nr:sugar transferase [bacterium]
MSGQAVGRSEITTFTARSRPRARLDSTLHLFVRMNAFWWMLLDVALAMVAIYLAYETAPLAEDVPLHLPHKIFFPIMVLGAAGVVGLYDRKILHSGLVRLFFSLVLTVVLSVVGLVLLSSVVLFEPVGRWLQLWLVWMLLVGLGVPRMAGFVIARLCKVRTLLVGGPEMADSLSRRQEQEDSQYKLVGFCCDRRSEAPESVGGIEDIPQICAEQNVHEIVIANEYANDARVLDACFVAVQSGCELLDENAFCEEAFEVVLVDQIDRGWFYTARLAKHNDVRAFLKRALDTVISTICLIVTAPLFLAIYTLVRLTSQGPAFYSQVRCGQFGRPFRIYKFRTMRVDAEKDGAQWAAARDTRVTPIGFFLRKSRLDEVPQFWNVLKGDMSFVGPRPERPEMVAEIEKEVPFFAFRHWARPGLTGLAQIRYRYGASVEDAKEKLQHDLYYIKNWSLLLDVQIILRTFSAIMKGAR